MKTTVKELDYEQAAAIPLPPHRLPKKPGLFWRALIRLLSTFGLAGTGFLYIQ